MARHVVIASGLDNPRQLSMLVNGDYLVAEAGHGSNDPDNCFDSDEGPICVGVTGKVTRVHNGQLNRVMTGLLSAAGKDGTFATGPDGASHRPDGPYYAIITGGDTQGAPPGLPLGQLGRLMGKTPNGSLHPVANISAYEQSNDPDGEGVDSNPYAVLALPRQILVADAAGDYIAKVVGNNVSLWAASRVRSEGRRCAHDHQQRTAPQGLRR